MRSAARPFSSGRARAPLVRAVAFEPGYLFLGKAMVGPRSTQAPRVVIEDGAEVDELGVYGLGARFSASVDGCQGSARDRVYLGDEGVHVDVSWSHPPPRVEPASAPPVADGKPFAYGGLSHCVDACSKVASRDLGPRIC